MESPKHPAKYTDAFMPVFADWLTPFQRVLDPFGGTGKLKKVRADAVCLDIEAEWAQMCGLRASALSLPFEARAFDAVCTSPTYGNRMADKTPGRVNYTAYLGRELHDENSGGMQWGDKYREFHEAAWREVARVAKAAIILNMKDHIRAGKQQFVTDWHCETIAGLGFVLVKEHRVATPGAATHLTNGDARVPYETIAMFERMAT